MPDPVFRRVLVGWDGSTGAADGLRLALKLTAFESGQTTALAIVPRFAHVEDVDDRARAQAAVREPLRIGYEAIVNSTALATGQRTALEFVEAADVAQSLDRYAATHPINLVIVGLHGLEGLLHRNMGHVASHAIQNCRCPVMVVPEPDATPHPTDEDEHGRLAHLFHPFRHCREATP